MTPSPKLVILLCCIVFISCGRRSRYPHAISDFPARLQPHLTRLVDAGIVPLGDEGFSKAVADNDLPRLARSEHPLLRAMAFSEMLDRTSFDPYKIVIEHLDDTALLFADEGEFGTSQSTVSDFILRRARWRTPETKNRTIDKVLADHNYLSSAYLILLVLEPQEKYYTYIKDMATRPRIPGKYEIKFYEVEQALYGLARFRKNEDLPIIRDRLLSQIHNLSGQSFQLMQQYPDTAYYPVLKQYYLQQFYKLSRSPYGFSGGITDVAAPEDFINALVMQQSDSSAVLLSEMIDYIPRQSCLAARDELVDKIVTAIWHHPCPAYKKLREKVKARALALQQEPLDLGPSVEPPEQKGPITYRWYP